VVSLNGNAEIDRHLTKQAMILWQVLPLAG